MPNIKIGANTYEGIEKMNFPLSDGSGYVAFGLEQLRATEYQGYIHDEVLEIINKVKAVQTDESITFVALADSHYPAEQTASTSYDANVKSSIQSNKALKLLAYMLDLDFVTHLGDTCLGAASTTPDMLKSQIEDFLSYFDEANSDVPCFCVIGNHDTGIYYHDAKADGTVYTMTGEYLYNLFTSKSASENTVFGGIEYGGYCYRDFPDKKLRVFMLNTSEKLVSSQKDQATYGSQRVWLANALLDLNNKADATEWGFLILSHYPADYGNTMPLSELLKAYVEGLSFAVEDPNTSYYVGDGTNTTVNFNGKNSARFIAQFHGHIHNFLASRLYSYATGSGVKYEGWRVCIPNSQFNRENTYTTVGSYTDINFAEDKAYNKTEDTANGTSFVVNVINPSEELIYSFCYGAGYDRIISFGETVYHGVSYALSNVVSTNTALSIEDKTAYTTTLAIEDGYELDSVVVTMGGVDITSTVYSNGVITIDTVTGDIVITARALAVTNYTNQIPISTGTDGAVYSGKGYKENTYLSSGNDGTRSGIYAVGYIPAKTGDVIRLKNVRYESGDSNNRLALYGSDRTMLTNAQFRGDTIATAFPDAQFDSNGYLTQFTMTHVYCDNMAYFRLCANYIGDDSVITVNEVID